MWGHRCSTLQFLKKWKFIVILLEVKPTRYANIKIQVRASFILMLHAIAKAFFVKFFLNTLSKKNIFAHMWVVKFSLNALCVWILVKSLRFFLLKLPNRLFWANDFLSHQQFLFDNDNSNSYSKIVFFWLSDQSQYIFQKDGPQVCASL